MHRPSKPSNKIIVCEDDAGILDVIMIALSGKDLEAIPCPDFSKLKRLVQKEKPRVLLLDLSLSPEELSPLLDEMKVKSPGMRVILMSANSKLPQIAEAHGVEHLSKPFSLEELDAAIL